MAIRLGTVVEDTITGLTGTAVGRTVYHTDCSRIEIQPRVVIDGKVVESTFAAEQVVRPVEDSPASYEEDTPRHPMLGEMVYHELTGFEGEVIAVSYYLHGAPHLHVRSTEIVKGKLVAFPFHENELVAVETDEPVELTVKRPGGPAASLQIRSIPSR